MRWSFKQSGQNSLLESRMPDRALKREYEADGIRFYSESVAGDWLLDPYVFGKSSQLVSLLGQLESDGFVQVINSDIIIKWSEIYELLENSDYADSLALLELPPIENWRFALANKGTLTDIDFGFRIGKWIDPDGKTPIGSVERKGALLKVPGRDVMLPRRVWIAADSAIIANSRPANERRPEDNRRIWGHVRRQALVANSQLDDFLKKTIVFSPEKLTIDLRRVEYFDTPTVEVLPGFDGQPKNWIGQFDAQRDVLDRYDIVDGDGIIHVIISPEVKTVLREIKRMPGRRVSGERAEAFERNPFAALGPDAMKVIDPAQFERARENAGLGVTIFRTLIDRNEAGIPIAFHLEVYDRRGGIEINEIISLSGPEEVKAFVDRFKKKASREGHCLRWKRFDLEILDDTIKETSKLEAALREFHQGNRFTAAEVFDLSNYSERIVGIGEEKKYYSPFIQKQTDESGWFPSNVNMGLYFIASDTNETRGIVLDEAGLRDFEERAESASLASIGEFEVPGFPTPVKTAEALGIIQDIKAANIAMADGTFENSEKIAKLERVSERRSLVLKPNIESVDYIENRGLLRSDTMPVELPSSLRAAITLKEHQLTGVEWLQHLWRCSPNGCRGALLADDMGLGKTLQLLTFMAWVIEKDPDAEPFLVVAPVSLLENWKEEARKFFVDRSFSILELYGAQLKKLRVSRDALDEELARNGAVRLLKRGWLSSEHKIVLTTYETLRDLEFTIAKQTWSAIICDEAQKIKNPNAMVTRAAKKQKARFRIACTGTPVENSLTDIWCLFDFVQPGLLRSLRDFGDTYRKPIETAGEGQLQRLDELRSLLDPQILRRMKADVAKDLPEKIFSTDGTTLQISAQQRALYARAVQVLNSRSAEQSDGPKGSAHLGILHYLRQVCSDPQVPGQHTSENEALAQIELRSPKMGWMLRKLEDIRLRREKTIVFCEFKDLQRTIQRAIRERLHEHAKIVNGDTSTSVNSDVNRQRIINEFQEREGFGVIILSPIAVGFGVNIQSANHVIHFTRTWNPAKEDQATDRAYRIGQQRDVYVYTPLIVAGDFLTFDVKLDLLLARKRALSDDILNGSQEVKPSDFADLKAPGGDSIFEDYAISLDHIRLLTPVAFEMFCALLWKKIGYSYTNKTPMTGDDAIDIVAIGNGNGMLIQCKSSSKDGAKLGWDAVKDAFAGAEIYRQRYPGIVFQMAAATNQYFNENTWKKAKTLDVQLYDCEALDRLLRQYPISRSEFEDLIFEYHG